MSTAVTTANNNYWNFTTGLGAINTPYLMIPSGTVGISPATYPASLSSEPGLNSIWILYDSVIDNKIDLQLELGIGVGATTARVGAAIAKSQTRTARSTSYVTGCSAANSAASTITVI